MTQGVSCICWLSLKEFVLLCICWNQTYECCHITADDWTLMHGQRIAWDSIKSQNEDKRTKDEKEKSDWQNSKACSALDGLSTLTFSVEYNKKG